MAMLEDAGYRMHEQGQLTRYYVINVLMHKRSREGQLLVEYHEPPEKVMTHAEELASLFRKRGYREWRIPQLVQEQLAREAEAEAKRKAEKFKKREAMRKKQRGDAQVEAEATAQAIAELEAHGRSQTIRKQRGGGPGATAQ